MSFLSRAHALSLFHPVPDGAIQLLREYVEQVPGTTVPGTWCES